MRTVQLIGNTIVVLLLLALSFACDGSKGSDVPDAFDDSIPPESMTYGEPLCRVLLTEARPGPSTIEGRVFDSRTEQPLQATAAEACSEESTETQADGSFQLTLDHSGRVYLHIFAQGYVDAWRLVRIYRNEVWLLDDIWLAPKDEAATSIGPEGGTHVSSDGLVEVAVPGGVLGTTVELRSTLLQRNRELPAPLPSSSAFTTAVDLDPDGTGFEGAVEVRIANTLGFDTDVAVPVGYFDKDVGRWVPLENGFISEDGEWMVARIHHFSSIDLNFPANGPAVAPPQESKKKPCKKAMSPFDVELLTGRITYSLPLPLGRTNGDPWSVFLHYDSFAAQGLSSVYRGVELGSVYGVPDMAVGMSVRVDGKSFGGARAVSTPDESEISQSMAALLSLPDLDTGLYHGEIQIDVKTPDATYAPTTRFGGSPEGGTGVPVRDDVVFSSNHPFTLLSENRMESPVGAGWMLGASRRVIETPGGEEVLLRDGENLLIMSSRAASSLVRWPEELREYEGVMAPVMNLGLDGNLILLALGAIWRWDGAGSATLVAGGGDETPEEGLLPENVQLDGNMIVEMPDGGFVVAEWGRALWYVRPGEPLRKIVDEYEDISDWETRCHKPDSGRAEDLSILWMGGMAVNPEGTLFVTDGFCGQVLAIFSDGTFELFAGLEDEPEDAWPRDGLPANQSVLFEPVSLVFAEDGTLFVGEQGAFRIRAIGPDGIMRTAVGGGTNARWEQGVEATDLFLDGTFLGIKIGNAGGRLVFRDAVHGLRMLTPDGRVDKLTGESIDILEYDDPLPNVGSLRAGEALNLGSMSFDFVGTSDAVYLAHTNGLLVIELQSADRWLSAEPGIDLELVKTGDGYTLRDQDGDDMAYFNAGGFVTREPTALGDFTYTYTDGDGDGVQDELDTLSHPLGPQLRASWSGGRLSSLALPSGETAALSYTDRDLASVEMPGGGTWTYGYDDAHRLTSIQDPESAQTRIAYTADGLFSGEQLPEGGSVTFTPALAAGFVPSAGESSLDSPQPPADPWHSSVIDPDGLDTYYGFSPSGAVGSMGSEAGRLYVDLDGSGRVVERGLIGPDGMTVPSEMFAYDGMGRMIGSEWMAGGAAWWTYDGDGRIDSVGYVDQPVINLGYDAEGRLITVTGTVSGSDEQARFVWTDDRITTIIDPIDREWHFTYDAQGNMASVTDPQGVTETWVRDSRGHLLSHTDLAGREWTYSTNEQGQITSASVAGGGTVVYGYDLVGRLNLVVDPLDRATVIGYNLDGFPYFTTHPVTGTETVTYSPAGRVQATSNAEGQSTVYAHDSGGWVIQRETPEGVVTYDRDSVGQVYRVTGPTGGYEIGYIEYGVVETVSTLDPDHQPIVTLQYQHTGSRRESVLRPSGVTQESFDTNHNMYIDEIHDMSIIYYDTWDPAQRPESGELQVQVGPLYAWRDSTYTFDEADRLTAMSHEHEFYDDDAGTSTYGTYDYDYTIRADGTVTRKSGPLGIETYTHDAAGRLETVTRDGAPAESFSYNEIGNRLASGGAPYVYDADGRLESDGTFAYTYDAAGRLVSKTGSSEEWTFTWSSQNLLLSARADRNGDGSFEHQVDYAYDPYGRRIEKNANGTVRRYLWDAWQLIEEYDASGNLLVERFYGTGRDQLLAVRMGGQTYQAVADRLGSVEIVLAVDGTEVSTMRYDAWGNVIDSTGTPMPELQVFAGHVYDPDVEMYYMRARYYDPGTGRFISPDQGSPMTGLSLYAYASGDPGSLIEPTGLAPAGPGGVTCPGGASDIVAAGLTSLEAAVNRTTGTISGYGRYLPDGCTYCNQFVQELLRDCYNDRDMLTGGGPEGKGIKNANQMVREMRRQSKENGKWEKVDTASEAMEWAKEGFFVVAGWENPVATKSGHVGVVVDPAAASSTAGVSPTRVGYDGWTAGPAKNLDASSSQPVLMQAGSTMGFMPVGNAFRKNKTVEYFVYKDDCGCHPQ